MYLNNFFWFRIVFSAYLSAVFLSCIFIAPELFQSLLPLNPDPLQVYNYLYANQYLNHYFIILSITSFGLCFRRTTLFSSIILLFNWIYFYHFLPHFSSPPSIAFIGWVLCWFVLNPKKNQLSFSDITVWWIIAGFAFFVSGLEKLNSQTWIDGNAILYLAKSPYSNFYLSNLIKFPWLLTLANYLILIIECGFIFLIFNAYTRKIAWYLMVGLGVSIVTFLNIPDIGLFFVIYSIALWEEIS